MADTFVKIYGTILDSSIWAEPQPTRIVWITMLAMADADGVVRASIGGLARRANVPKPDVEAALETLSGPDPDTRDGSAGHRIERLPDPEGGWRILNHSRYRDKRSPKQIATAERVRRFREREKAKLEQAVTDNDVTTDLDPDTDTDTDLIGSAAARSDPGSPPRAREAAAAADPNGSEREPTARRVLWAFADAWAFAHGERPDASESNLKRAAKVVAWLDTLPREERSEALAESVAGAASRIKNADRPIAVWAADPGSFRTAVADPAELAALRDEYAELESKMRHESRDKILDPMRERRVEIRTRLEELGHG